MTAPRTLRLGTRGSKLALAQSHMVADELRRISGDNAIEMVTIKTQGDRILDRPLAQVPGKGFFVKEIQKALVDGEIDLAVHSLKDLPVDPVPGIVLAAVPGRASPFDVLVTPDGRPFESLDPGTVVGTSSARRRFLLAHARPDLGFVDLRGNVDTRLAKLGRGDCGAIVLARAGLVRLGMAHVRAVDLPLEVILPAVGQGALAIEAREDDGLVRELLARLDDPPTRVAVLAERAFLGALGGGCSAPIGALGRTAAGRLSLDGVVCSPDGHEVIRGRVEGPAECGGSLATELARELLSRGADRCLAPR